MTVSNLAEKNTNQAVQWARKRSADLKKAEEQQRLREMGGAFTSNHTFTPNFHHRLTQPSRERSPGACSSGQRAKILTSSYRDQILDETRENNFISITSPQKTKSLDETVSAQTTANNTDHPTYSFSNTTRQDSVSKPSTQNTEHPSEQIVQPNLIQTAELVYDVYKTPEPSVQDIAPIETSDLVYDIKADGVQPAYRHSSDNNSTLLNKHFSKSKNIF